MLRRANDLTDFSIDASDGVIGRVDDFFYDDETWTVRYIRPVLKANLDAGIASNDGPSLRLQAGNVNRTRGTLNSAQSRG